MFSKRASASVASGEEADPRTQRQKPGWFEQRARRRRRRKRFEELLGWIIVPALIYLGWLGFQAVGGIPKELVDFGSEIVGMALKSI
jgi:hypothetical protein